MSKLSLEALKQRAEATASNDLLATISGGTENDCHPVPPVDNMTPLTGNPLIDPFIGLANLIKLLF